LYIDSRICRPSACLLAIEVRQSADVVFDLTRLRLARVSKRVRLAEMFPTPVCAEPGLLPGYPCQFEFLSLHEGISTDLGPSSEHGPDQSGGKQAAKNKGSKHQLRKVWNWPHMGRVHMASGKGSTIVDSSNLVKTNIYLLY
jgi:hypothetical protein